MPDEEGYMLVGELGVGGYAALEADLGESLMGPLGFAAYPPDPVEIVSGPPVPGFATRPVSVVYEVGSL